MSGGPMIKVLLCHFLILLFVLWVPRSHAGVTNGTAVNAANTNAAFMDKNTTTTFTISIADIQGGIETKSANDAASTGANQNVTLTAPITIYTNGSLTSIQNITLSNRQDASLISIRNNTGGTLTLRNLSGGTAALQINTGTGSDLALPAGTGCSMYYDTVNTKWQVISMAGADVSAANIGAGILAVARGGTGIASGTSGGILGYTAIGTLASSGALTANQVIVGGGAGATPLTLAAGSQYQSLTMGAANPGYSAINLAQSAAVTGALTVTNGGTGLATLTAHSLQVGNGTGTVTQIAVPASGTLLTGVAASDPAFSATPTLGVNATTTGILALATSVGSGQSISVKNGGATSAYNFILPVTVGSAGTVLTSQGGGSTAMTWSSLSALQTVSAKTSAYTTLSTDNVLTFDMSGASNASYAVTLLTAVGNTGLTQTFSITAGTGTLSVNTTSSQTVGTLSSGVWAFKGVGNTMQVVSDGTNWQVLTTPNIQPKITTYTSGTTTFTTQVGPSQIPTKIIRVLVIAGGGGGGSSGTGSFGASTNGGASTFGSSLISTSGGNGGAQGAGGTGGAIGTVAAGSTGQCWPGGSGTGGNYTSSVVGEFDVGGNGGNSIRGGGAGGGAAGTNQGYTAATSSGGGGGGGGIGATTSANTGAGGGAGSGCEAIIVFPQSIATTFSAVVGAKGNGGTLGTSGAAGGDGAAGVIVVEEDF